MPSVYTQLLARVDRPTQIYGALSGLDVYTFPHTAAGTLICERTSEALDVRIVVQVAQGVSWWLGRGWPVLAIAGDRAWGFWCGLFDGGGEPLFEHNRLTGPRSFRWRWTSRGEVERLRDCLGTDARLADIQAALSMPWHWLSRHTALAKALRLPSWSVGMGYSRVVAGAVPPEAGTPARPPRRLADVRPLPEWIDEIDEPDSRVWFQRVCQRAFGFLEEDFGFRRDPPRLYEPGYQNPYLVAYRSRKLSVVIETISHGTRTRLCLIDPQGHLLDLTGLVKRRDPGLLDLCNLAAVPKEQVLVFAEALWTCAVDVLEGDLRAISRIEEVGPGFSFSVFYSRSELDHFIACHGPQPGTDLMTLPGFPP